MNNKYSNRKSIRLNGFNYSKQGWYYLTICTQNRKCIFGNIINRKMILNNYGKIVEKTLVSLPEHYPVNLDISQIMPNHVHFVIQIIPPRGLIHQTRPFKFGQWMGMINHAPTLGHIVRYFKAKSSRLTNHNLWQRNFYEHIIRTEPDLNKIRRYIQNNPKMWDRDRNNPDNIRVNSIGGHDLSCPYEYIPVVGV